MMKARIHRAAGCCLGVGLGLLMGRGHLGAASGSLDPSFSYGGTDSAPVPAVFRLFIQSDDRILLAAADSASAMPGPGRLVRLLPGGAPDTNYPGALSLAPPHGVFQSVGMELLPEDRLVADAVGLPGLELPGGAGGFPVRVLSDGTLDAGFAPGARRPDGSVLPGGATVLAGLASGETIVQANGLRRLTPSGALDLSWGKGNGDALIPGFFTAAAGQSSGHVIAWGQPGAAASRDLSLDRLMRFDPDGIRDAHFPAWRPIAATGRYGDGDLAVIRRVAVLPDDKILLVGTFSGLSDGAQVVPRGSIARLNADGSMDTGFGSEVGFTDVYSYPETPQWNATNARSVYAMAVAPDGRIVVGGDFSGYDGVPRTNVARLNPDGSLDLTFEPRPPEGWVTQVGVQSDGRVILACGRLANVGGLPPYDGAGPLVRLQGGPVSSAVPVITRQPLSQEITVPKGQTRPVIFEVAALSGSSEPLLFQWRRNGAPLRDGAGIQGAHTAVLSLPAAGPADAGRYECIVAGVGGRVVSEPAFLTVNGSASPVPDTAGPQLLVTSPSTLETRTVSGTVTFHGVASDRVGLAWVMAEQDGGGFHPVRGLESWQSTHALLPGTNRFRFEAIDLAGNRSRVIERTVVRVVYGPFLLQIAGAGNVQRPSLGNSLELGRAYALQATPKPGNLFSNWMVNGVSYPDPILRFVMVSNLEVTANFVPNPFPPRAGAYTGLFYDPGAPAHVNAGALHLKVAEQGSFAGRLVAPAGSCPLAGHFDLALRAQQTLALPDGRLVVLQLRLGDDAGRGEIAGSVEAGGATLAVAGHRAGFDPQHPFTIRPVAYTLLLSAGGGSFGHGFATVGFSPTGQGKLKGLLADGTPWLCSAPLSARGRFPVHVMFPAGRGSIFGWLTLGSGSEKELEGALIWTRVGLATNTLRALGSRYEAGGRNGEPLPGLNQGMIVLQAGGRARTNLVSWERSNHLAVAPPNPDQIQLRIRPANGLLEGSFFQGTTGKRIALRGVVLEEPGVAGGFFRGDDPGVFYLGPPGGFPLFADEPSAPAP